MKILKKGNYLRAICTEDNEVGTRFSVGQHMGSISIDKGKFTGATACLIELDKARDLLIRKEVAEARATLEKHGYYTGNLWHVIDVESRYICDKGDAMEVLDNALTNNAIMENIWDAIDLAAREDLGLNSIKG
jgi:hypothetical protein